MVWERRTSNRFIKVAAARHSKWKVFQKQTYHLTSTIYLLLRCSSEKQILKYILKQLTLHVFFYKHVVYKHIQAQVWRLFKHMLSIMLSLAKYYCVKHFWVAWIFLYWLWFFVLSIAKHFPSDSSKMLQNKWCSLEARWLIIL